MDENQEKDPSEQFEAELQYLVDRFNGDRKELLDYLKSSADDWASYDPDMLPIYIHNTSRSFAKVALALHGSASDREDAKQLLTRFWKADDNDRVTVLRQIAGNEKHNFVDDEEASGNIEEIYEKSDTTDELEENILKRYRLYLGTDVNILLGQIYNTEGSAYDQENDDDDELFDQPAQTLELVKLMEKVAEQCSSDFKKGYEDGCSMTKATSELEGEIFTKSKFSAERSYDNVGGELETHVQYEITNLIRYTFAGFEALPLYIQELLIQTAGDEDDENPPFDLMDLAEEGVDYYLDFTYGVVASDNGTFWHYTDLSMFMDDMEIPIPDVRIVAKDEPHVQEQNPQLSEKETEFFGDIFTEDELSQFSSILEDFSDTNSQEKALLQVAPDIIPNQDMVELFRQRISDINGAPTSKHLLGAQNLAKGLLKTKNK